MNFVPRFIVKSTVFILLQLFLLKLGFAQSTDLRIDFDPTVDNLVSVQVGSYFSIQGLVSLDTNSSTVPAGETIVATIQFIDPDGLIIDSHTQTWNGFPENGNPGNLDNDTTALNQVLFQVPWSEAAKWGPNEQWQVVARVSGAALESDLTDNVVSHSFGLQVPNLVMADANVNGTTFLPNADVVVSATITNQSNVQTQNGVFFPIEARLFRGTITAASGPVTGQVLDRERLIVPFADQGITPTLLANDSISAILPPLRLPADADGNFTIQVIVDPNDMQPLGSIVAESEESVDNHLFINFTITQGVPNLQVIQNSFTGEIGTFRGLDPIRLGFSLFNNSTFAVDSSDNLTARVVLSLDDIFNTEDFILREFDLGGNALGAQLLPNETLQLDWIQQMPDNLEGDYYLLLQIEETGQVFPLQNTPVINLNSKNEGQIKIADYDENSSSTELINQIYDLQEQIIIFQDLEREWSDWNVSTASERQTLRNQIDTLFIELGYAVKTPPRDRPSTSSDGRWLVYETNDYRGNQQIFLVNIFAQRNTNQSAILISKSQNDPNSGGNGNSLRPKISGDGNYVVFHSRADDLVAGDNNDAEDIFVYSVEDDRLFRLTNPMTGEEGDRASYYPDVNFDGSVITFESRSSNLSTETAFSNGSRQIHLWSRKLGEPDSIRLITTGNANSHLPSISDDGRFITYASDATNLLTPPSIDDNNLRDIFVFDADTNDTRRVSLSQVGEQTMGGLSDQPVMSGDGRYIAFRSEATNMVMQGGVAQIIIDRGGAGYFGTPTLEVVDLMGIGEGAEVRFKVDGINQYGQIQPDGIEIISAGENYRSPQIVINGDPLFPPTQTATCRANLVNYRGEVYRVSNPFDPTGTLQNWVRVSESPDGIGGNMPSREPAISDDGSLVVFSTQASNFLEHNVTREDGITYYNRPVRQAQAQAVLLGGIGEIEVQSAGSGYQNGFLSIDDLSGNGSGASASYTVDSFGRISSVTVINAGTNYNLATTEIGVDNPRGGAGFEAGELRFAKERGFGRNRSGGGRVHQVIMTDHGMGYQYADDSIESLNSLLLIDGDGVDADADGRADAQINPEKIYVDPTTGSIYLEQTYSIRVLSTASLVGTTLKISDANDSVSIIFSNNLTPSSPPNTIAVVDSNLTSVRNQIITIIENTWGASSSITSGPMIEENATGGNSFLLTALSGQVTVSNPSSLEVIAQTNLLFSGAGFTRATPIFTSPPAIHGFSEIVSGTTVVSVGNGRNILGYAEDRDTDDIYLYEESANGQTKRERISRSSFGFPVNYRPSKLNSMPSNRLPTISGNGRHIYFSSDASDEGGLVFDNSNQRPEDNNNGRDIYYFDRKTASIPTAILTIDLLFPNRSVSHSFAPNSQIPIVAQVNYSGNDLDRLELLVNGISSLVLDEFSPNIGTNRFSGVHQTPQRGTHSYQVVAFNSADLAIGASAPVEISINSTTNSLPPVLGLDNLVFDSATISSSIPISITGTDEDDALVGVQYYVDGLPFGDEILRDARSSAQLNSFSSALNFSRTGVKSIFAIGRDSAGNYVSTAVESISVTPGNSNLSVSFNEGPGSLLLSEPQIQLNLSGTGEIIELGLPLPVGQNFVGPPEIEVIGLGTGAEVEAEIDHNESSITYGMITGLTLINRGQDYEQNSTTLKIVPVIRAIGNGTPAEVQLLNMFGGGQSINLVSNIDGSLRQGSGYTVSPALITPPFRFVLFNGQSFERLPLDGNSRVAPFEIGPTATNVFTADPFLIGGFAQAPIPLAYSVSSPEELESLTLIVDGQDVASVSEAPFVFNWIPDEAKVYTIFAAASDFSGNVVMSPPNYVRVEEFRGGGISAELHSDSNVTSAIANSTIFISGEAYSEFGIAEVEFFIDGISKGKAFPEAGSEMFSAYIDLTGLPSGEHVLSMIARDYGGNQAGTFERELTNSESKQSQTLLIYPASNNVDKKDVVIKFPNPEYLSTFSPLSFIPVIADLNVSSGLIGKTYAQVVLDGVAIGSMEQFGVEDSLDPQDGEYLSHRFTYTIDPSFTSVGNHRLQLVFYRSGTDKTVLMSEIIEFEVSEYSRASQNIFLQPFIFESVTSDSTIPVSITGTTDQDNALLAVQYYVDGVPTGDEIIKDTNSFQRINTYSSAISFNDTGVKSIFAVGRDFMGNYLSSPVESIQVTEGSSDISISFADGPQSLMFSGNEVQLTLSSDGQILQVGLPFPVGKNFVGNPYVEVMGAGTGAEIDAVVDQNLSSPTHGMITELKLINGGQGYLTGNTSLKISPVIKSIKRGTSAELQLSVNPESITIVRNADQTLRTGFGYVTSPRIVIPPYSGFVQIPRAPILPNGSIDPSTFPILIGGSNPPIEDVFLVGGFTQSPIHFNFSVTNPEQLESLRLIIDGEEEGLATEHPFTFSWIPDEAKIYTVYAAAEDLFGNVTMSPPNYVKVEEFSGGGISASLNSDSNTTAAIANSTIFVSGEANSEFGVAEVEFFIDGISKGKTFPEKDTDKFGKYIDLTGLSSGEHTISMIARDNTGNQIGTFNKELTTLESLKSQSLLIFPSSKNAKQSDVIVRYPTPGARFSFQSSIPVILDLNVSSQLGESLFGAFTLDGQVIGFMEQHTVSNTTTPELDEYQSRRFTFSIPPSFTWIGTHKAQIIIFRESLTPFTMSEIFDIEITELAQLSPTISINDLPYDNITDTSNLVISATGSDLDADFKGVTFFLDGVPMDSEKLRTPFTKQSQVDYFTMFNPKSEGVFSIHAEGRDNSGNIVASDLRTFMVTGGTPRSEVFIPDPIKGIHLKSSQIKTTKNDNNNSLVSIELLEPIDIKFYSEPDVSLLGTGSNAIVEPVIDYESGELQSFNVKNGGQGYTTDSLEITLSQQRRVVRVGTPAQITTRWFDVGDDNWVDEEEIDLYLRQIEYNKQQSRARLDQNASGGFGFFGIIGFSFLYRDDGITYYNVKRRFDGTPIAGEGYVIAPKFTPPLNIDTGNQVLAFDRWPLAPPTPGGTSSIDPAADFQYDTLVAKGSLKGGFTRAPIYLEAVPSVNGKNIESVSLLVNGSIDPANIDETPPFAFEVIVEDPGKNLISFGVKDFDGNIFFTEPSLINVENHYGSGIVASFTENNASNELSSAVQIGSDNIFSVSARSEYGIREVEFFIDGSSAGFGEDLGDGKFSFIEDFSGYTQGDHYLSFVARDNRGNESGTFEPSLTNIEQFKHKLITLVASSGKKAADIFPIPRNVNGIPTNVKFKLGSIASINMAVESDYDVTASRVYLLSNGEKLKNINGDYFVEYDFNSTLHKNGIFSFSFIPQTEGNYTLTPMVLDSEGKQKFSRETINMEVVQSLSSYPVVDIIYPSSEITISDFSSTRFVTGVSNMDNSLVGIQYYVNGIKYGDFLYYDKSKPKDSSLFPIDFKPPFDQDVNIVTAVALDSDGNQNFAPAVIVKVISGDELIPNIQFDRLNPIYSENQSLFLSAEVSDKAYQNFSNSIVDGVIEEVSFIINGEIARTFTQPPYFWIWDANQSGLYNIFVSARDNEGNIAVSDSYTTQVGTLYGQNKPLLGSTTPSILGQVKIYDGLQQVTVSASQRRISQTNEVEKTTIIQGLSTQFLSQLTEGQIVRFANGTELSSKNYVVLEIADDETLKLQGEMVPEDLALLTGWSELQFFNVYRVGSLIPLNLSSSVNDDSYVAVEFYENGTLIERDVTWPYSSSFVPMIEGNYTIAVVAENITGEQSLFTERIEVLPKLGFLPDGSTSILPDLTRRGSTTIGSELLFIAEYDDIDSGMNRVEFFLNGDLIHIDREKPFYCKFQPQSDSDIFSADRSWEVVAVGIDNDQNRVAFSEEGTVQSSILLPKSEIKVPLNGNEYAHEQSIKIRVDVNGNNLDNLLGRSANILNPNVDLTPRQMNILGNGEFICVAQESKWGSGIFLAEWVCDKNLAGESGEIELVGSIVMEDAIVGGLPFTPSVISNIISIKVVEPELFGDPKALVNQTFKDLLGKSPSEQEVNAAITVQMENSSTYLYENDDFLRWAAHISEKAIFENMVNAIGGYHVMIGEYPDYLKVSEIMDTYSAIPNYGQDGSIDEDGDGFSLRQENLFLTSDQDASNFPDNAFSMGSFVDDTLSSRDFTDSHNQVPALTPPANGNDRFTNHDENRREFVRLIYNNKYGTNPSFVQEKEGAYRIAAFDPNSQEAKRDERQMMIQQMSMYSNFGFGGVGGGQGQGGGGNVNPFAALLGNTNAQNTQQSDPSFRNGEPAVLFVVNMIVEEKINQQPMIYGAPEKRDYYKTAALITSFWQENLGVMSDDLISEFHGMDTEVIISTLIKDSRYTDRFGGISISKKAESIEKAPGWKYLDWFGYYNDKDFPWVFHSELGWIYIHSPSGNEAWIFVSEIGWFWTAEEIWSNRNPDWILWLYEQERSRWVGYYHYEPIGKELISKGKTFWDPQSQKDFTYE